MKTTQKITMLCYCFYFGVHSLLAASTGNSPVRVAKYKEDKLCAISFTFDDGLREHYTLVTPEMKKRNLVGTFWINGASVNEDEHQLKDTTRVSWSNLQEMAALGHEISNHGWSHKKLTTIQPEEVKLEIERNDSIILEKIGIPSRTFCYAYNAKNDTVLRMTSENRVGTRTKQYAVGNRSTTPKLEEWINTLIETREWGVEMIHGITYGYDAFTTADILWQHFDRVSALQDKIWVATFHEVAAYTKEVEALKLDIKQTSKGWYITPHLSLDKRLFTEPLTLVIDKADIKKIKIKQGKRQLPVRQLPNKAMFEFNPYGESIRIEIK